MRILGHHEWLEEDGAEGAPDFEFVVATDVQFKTLNSLFERLEKSYNEINNFSSNVAHELQAPLQPRNC